MHELVNVRTGKEIRFPSEIDELSPREYLFYLQLYLKQLSGEITDPHVIKRQLFTFLVDLKVSFRMQFYKRDTLQEIWSALTQKIDLLDSFFDIEPHDDHLKYTMKIKSGINLLPEWRHYKGPETMLTNLKWGDFVRCLDYMKQLQSAIDSEDLQQIQELSIEIFNVMYKPKNSHESGLFRRKIKYDLEFDAVVFHCITYFKYIYELITTIEIPYKGNEIPFYIIWEKDDEDDDSKSDMTEWDGILFMLAESGTFGTAETVNNYNMWEILLYLYKQKFQTREQRRKDKKDNHGTT